MQIDHILQSSNVQKCYNHWMNYIFIYIYIYISKIYIIHKWRAKTTKYVPVANAFINDKAKVDTENIHVQVLIGRKVLLINIVTIIIIEYVTGITKSGCFRSY